jgi:rhodanese-related sulfurtransferase
MENLDKIIADGALVLDVRTKEEYAQGHIEGSLNVPLDEINTAMKWLLKDVPIITVCASGNRSKAAKEMLEANGYKKVYNGGAWDSLGNIKVGACPADKN